MPDNAVWVVTMFPTDRMYQHNGDKVFRHLADAKVWALKRLHGFNWTPRPDAHWFDVPQQQSNYTDNDGERWITIMRREVV